jgi:hypothetical protein
MIVVAMRIPLVIATAVVLTVALAVGVVSLSAGTGDDRPLEPITVRAPAVPVPAGQPGPANPVNPADPGAAAPPQRLPEPAPRDPEGYVAPPPPVDDDDDDDGPGDDGPDDDD